MVQTHSIIYIGTQWRLKKKLQLSPPPKIKDVTRVGAGGSAEDRKTRPEFFYVQWT